jgi:hypothetical protein
MTWQKDSLEMNFLFDNKGIVGIKMNMAEENTLVHTGCSIPNSTIRKP